MSASAHGSPSGFIATAGSDTSVCVLMKPTSCSSTVGEPVKPSWASRAASSPARDALAECSGLVIEPKLASSAAGQRPGDAERHRPLLAGQAEQAAGGRRRGEGADRAGGVEAEVVVGVAEQPVDAERGLVAGDQGGQRVDAGLVVHLGQREDGRDDDRGDVAARAGVVEVADVRGERVDHRRVERAGAHWLRPEDRRAVGRRLQHYPAQHRDRLGDRAEGKDADRVDERVLGPGPHLVGHGRDVDVVDQVDERPRQALGEVELREGVADQGCRGVRHRSSPFQVEPASPRGAPGPGRARRAPQGSARRAGVATRSGCTSRPTARPCRTPPGGRRRPTSRCR